MDQPTITLPGVPTPIAPLGVGTWAWGDRSTWGMGGYDAELTEDTIAGAWDASLADALGWTLTPDDMDELDGVALEGIVSLANRFWQHG